MNKKQRNTILVVLMTLVLTFMSVPTTAKADISTEQVTDIFSGSVNGVERTLVSTSTDSGIKIYLKVGDADFNEICDFGTQAIVNENGIIWIIQDNVYHTLMCWSYDFDPKMNPVSFTGYDSNVESFIVKGSGTQTVGVGYKTFSGEIKSFPSFNDMKEIMDADSSIPELHYIPSSKTPILPTVTPIPVVTEPAMLSTPTPVPTIEPTVAPKSTTAPKLSIKRSKTTSTIYEGKKVVSKATLKKGTLTWKRWVEKTKRYKTKTYKGVKSSALILKSKNLVYLSKKGVVDIRSYKTGKRIKRFKKVKDIKCIKGSAVRIELINGKKVSIKNL